MIARPHQRYPGFTLVELIIALVVISAATAGILVVYQQTVASSADPLLRAQARSIAEAYMDEITLRAYEDPPEGVGENGNGSGTAQDCGTGGSGTVSEGESRKNYDDVWDYHSIDKEQPTTQVNASVSELDAFTVDIKIKGDHSAGDEAQIVVCVEHDTGKVDYRLVSERWRRP